jgi:hypothetical protein
MNRPPLPPERISRCTPTFQFPKSLLRPALKAVAALKDHGWLPAVPLRQHVVICGFPRSGTTLFQLMMEGCVRGIGSRGRERRALEVAECGRRSHAALLTKRPKDLFLIREIREFYANRGVQVQFILLHRDPRAVLTSRHFSRPTEYYLSTEEWRHYYRHWDWCRKADDVLSVRYEDLIRRPEEVQRHVLEFTGWEARWNFRDFVQHVPKGFDGRALNALRELDETRLLAWRSGEHRTRLREVVRELPELPQVLVELAYEPDEQWLDELSLTSVERAAV